MIQSTKLLAEQRLEGIPVSPGIAVGHLHIQARGVMAPEHYAIHLSEVEAEWERFEKALRLTEEQLESLKVRVATASGEKEAAIFDAHILFLADKALLKNVRMELEKRLQNIESVFYAVVQNFLESLRRVDDPYLRSRTSDMEDVMVRVLENLKTGVLQQPAPLHAGSGEAEEEDDEDGATHILIAYDLTPSDTAAMDRERILGFATETGSDVSHTAILARSLGLPAIVGISRLVLDTTERQEAILDGYRGRLILNPTEETKHEYSRLQIEKDKAYKTLEAMRDLPTETKDGRHIRLAANVEFAHECENIKASGAEGVGLYRTEFFLLGEKKLPDEEAQTRHYTNLIKGCAPHEVVFRTLDAGGDKLPFEMLDEPESNPFLGWRGIRVSLSRPAIFKEQLRAILRASAAGSCGIMFPMISGVTEVIRVRELFEECKKELRDEGVPYGDDIRVGVMIEVPSAAMIADVLAEKVDFFSIGTNDLTQYTIAVDRVNARVARMFRPTHPGVIRLIDMTISAGERHGVPTSICGEMAGDITMLPLLIGLGAREVSVGVHVVPIIRYAIRHLHYWECKDVARQALQAHDSMTVRALSEALAWRSYPKLFN